MSSTPDDGLTPVAKRVSAYSITECLKEAGADIKPDNNPTDGAETVFAELPNGTLAAFVVADSAAVARETADAFAQQGRFNLNKTADPRVLVVFRDETDSTDRAVAAKCVKPPS